MGFIYALRSEQEKTKHTSFWAIHFCVPVMGALLFLAYYSQYASTADSKKLKMILEITTTFFPVLISVIVGLNVALEEKASHFQTLLAVPNRHKNMLAKLTYLYGSGVFALFFLFLLFVIGIKERLGHEKIQTTLGTYGHLYPNTNLEVAKKLTGILQVQSATESIANYTSNQHTAIYHRTVEEK